MKRIVLQEKLRELVPMTEQQYAYVLSHFSCRQLKKKDYLYTHGEICKYVVFCEEGCFRKFFLDTNGNEIVVEFNIEGYWIGDLHSRVNKVPTKFFFQALEDSTLQVAGVADWDKLASEIPSLAEVRTKVEKRNHHADIEQLMLQKYGTAEEKLDFLMKKLPGITNRIAGKYIASYLGIEPESYSRLKNKLTRKT
ncbi:Crp/Fnr family transcriptional regulator [Runella salmonicolor]|uniref:Crp/Fnr family transcriptional regulator n=1 Tax=Runella salmonicolor TaxID=2950278 RepID=A0ABT1FPI6_9BACT|nr:Crp/Fnr family transcriptional regulator [Runella salmonicolor]MCP1383689.1 Crp/Fnr family transcriptional regulator [Runella salmonicolor]